MAFSACLRSEFGRLFRPGIFAQSVSSTVEARQLETRHPATRVTTNIVKLGYCPRNFTNTLLALIPMNEDTEALIPLMCARFENARLRWIRNSPPKTKPVQALSPAISCASPKAGSGLLRREHGRSSHFASARLRQKERT